MASWRHRRSHGALSASHWATSCAGWAGSPASAASSSVAGRPRSPAKSPRRRPASSQRTSPPAGAGQPAPAAAAALHELRAGIYQRIDLLEWVCRSNPDTLAVQEFAPTQGLAPGSYDIRDLAAEAVKAVDATTQADPKRVLVEVYAMPEPT